ncbi:MAG: tripartite tricarboxylate transporter substrate binding protein, partial [Pigmentiphaga sp.]|nr:tripartite tricarboxylate transporter substrate binding protein [Pigmentiphaga sp.]
RKAGYDLCKETNLKSRKLKIGCLSALLCVPMLGMAAYPERPIRIVVPYTPGTSPDIIARLIVDKLGNELGQNTFVENRPGAATAIGTNSVAKANPDGYTLMVSINSHVITPATRTTPYDPVKDFAPIGQIGLGQLAVLVGPSTKAQTFPELVKELKEKGDEATYSSPGMGSTTQLYSIVLQDILGTNMRHIPGSGMGSAMMDVMQGNTNMVIGGLDQSLPNIQSGKLRALAQTGKEPSKLLPNVKSISQYGYPEYDFAIWVGMYAPAKTSPEIIKKLNATLNKVMALPEIRDAVESKSYSVVTGTPEAFGELTRKEFEYWKAVVKKHGLMLDK